MKNLKIKNKLNIIIATGLTTLTLLTTGCSNKENDAIPITSDEVTTNSENDETKNTNETFDNFESEKNDINSLIYTDNFEKADEVWSEYFINAIDMIFYDKEYKGTKWEELTEEAKKKAINNLTKIDQSITEIYPEYKEDWQKTKGIATETYFEALNKIKEVIGEDNYDNIKEIKDSIKSKTKEIGNNIKDKADEWYQEYKSYHTK